MGGWCRAAFGEERRWQVQWQGRWATCYGPRATCRVPHAACRMQVAQICKQHEIPHLINNAYGVQVAMHGVVSGVKPASSVMQNLC